MNSSFTPTAAVTVLAATAAAAAGTYVSAPLFAGLLKSTPFLWAAANVIIIVIWLLSNSRHRNTASSPAGHAGDVLSAVDDLYPPSDYEGYSSSVVSSGEGPVASTPRRQAREARAARRADRPRLPKPKPAGEAAATTRTAAAVEPRARPDAPGDDRKRGDVHEAPTPRTVVAAAAAAVEAKPEDDDDVSLDSLWQSMLQRRAVRPVSVKKSETWGNDELPRLQRAAETAAQRREMRKSASTVAPAPPPPQPRAEAPSAARQLGWRTRDVLMRAHDDLLRRAESLIRRHHEHLRLQRQESDQRRAMELQQRGRPNLIRV